RRAKNRAPRGRAAVPRPRATRRRRCPRARGRACPGSARVSCRWMVALRYDARMAYANIHVDVTDSIATLTIDRAAVKNALDLQTVSEAGAALQAPAADGDVGVLIVTGGGEAAFVSGADINDIRARGRDEGLAAINSSLFAEIERFPRPTIAAVNGY